jgi:hypothetical protein
MGQLRNYIAYLKTITQGQQERAVLDIVKANEPVAVDLNTSQLMQGKDANDDAITPAYTPFTQEIKRGKRQPTDRVTLKDEGDFHQSFFIRTEKFPVVFAATDWKTEDLKAKYGDQIFGLTKANLGILNQDYLKEEIQQYYRSLLLVP